MADKTKDRLLSNIIISVGSVLVLLAVLIFVGLDARNIAGEVLTSRSELNIKFDELEKLAQLREEAKLAEPKIEFLKDILPNRDDLFTFTEEIEALGNVSGVDASFFFGSESDGNISYGIKAVGSYDEIIDYLQVIEEEVPFMSVFGVDIITVDKGYKADINGKVFFNE